jgi:glycosyltransferase involved in cell wall biosynthesis
MTTTTESLPEQVKSRLLPLSSLMVAVERLIERLPRILISVELLPTDDVMVINDKKKGEYNATGGAPVFEMTFGPASPHGSWYYLEAALVRNNGNRVACIYADIRTIDKDCIAIPIPTNFRGSVREVFYLPPEVRALRWSPTAEPGIFSQSQLLIHRINPLESALRRVSRVIFDLWRFRNRTSAANAGLSWWGAINNLQDAYQRTATLRLNRMSNTDYPAFIARNGVLKESDIRAMRKQIQQLPLHPIISLIMQVHSPNEELFRAALDSVTGQIYPYWELVLAGNFSADTKTLIIANEYRSRFFQIKIVSVKPNANQAVTLNSALDLVHGKFVTRIGQHDLITPHALNLFAQEINKYPDSDLVYSDDDSIDDNNQRHDPRFKPDWNPDLFFSCNYLANLTLYRLTRLQKIGGYRTGFEGATDYDLSLRYIKDIPETNIRHIPKVLCHSRAPRQSSVSSAPLLRENNWKGEAAVHKSEISALEAHFKDSGITVAEGPAHGLYRIKHPLPEQPPLVSIIIPTRDQVGILKKCIESIRQNTDYDNWEMLVVDNQSEESETHTYLDQIQSDTRIKVIRYEKPFNYSALNNFAVQHAKGEVLALLNNDVEVIAEEWLTEMVSHAIRMGIGAVGAKLLYSNGTVQHAGVILGLGGVAGHAHRYLKGDEHGYCHRAVVTQNLSAVTGACMVVRKSCYLEVAGLNETDLAVAFNDIDFCLKLVTAGYRNLYTPYALLYHHESISRGRDDTPEKHARFVHEFEYMKRIWGGILQNDIAYNPNLTLEFETFALGNSRETRAMVSN